jgi:nucleoside-diphosphate-sugar epimerase
LTGATGFLGGAIASVLLAGSRWRDVLFLVRAANPQEGERRLAQSMARFALSPSLVQRVSADQILCGDVCDAERFAKDARLRDVREVVNCAAFASFSNHPQIFRTNVQGTLEFARLLASEAPLRRFVQVGTAMSCGPEAPKVVAEGFEPAENAVQLVPYTASKLQGEQRLRSELPSLPLVIVRPSIVVGHTRLGCRPSPSIFWVFRMARALRRFLCPADSRIDIVPVDYCAGAILRLLEAPRLACGSYHISSGTDRSCTFRQIDKAIAEALGEPPTDDYRQVDYETLQSEQHRFDELFGPCIKPIMLRAIRLYGEFASLDMVFDNRHLLGEGIAPPPRFTDYAGLCALTAEDAPIASQMQYDFKGLPATIRAGEQRKRNAEMADQPGPRRH